MQGRKEAAEQAEGEKAEGQWPQGGAKEGEVALGTEGVDC